MSRINEISSEVVILKEENVFSDFPKESLIKDIKFYRLNSFAVSYIIVLKTGNCNYLCYFMTVITRAFENCIFRELNIKFYLFLKFDISNCVSDKLVAEFNSVLICFV